MPRLPGPRGRTPERVRHGRDVVGLPIAVPQPVSRVLRVPECVRDREGRREAARPGDPPGGDDALCRLPQRHRYYVVSARPFDRSATAHSQPGAWMT